MKTMNREELKEIFRSKWIKSSYTQEECDKIEAIIEKLVDDLYNTNQPVVYPLTERNTYIIRKLNGILDNGVCQTQRSVADELGFAHARIGQLLERIMRDLHTHRVRRVESKTLSAIKMSSADLNSADENKNIEIGTLNLKPQTIRELRSLDVATLQDLLTLSMQDLKNYFGDITLRNIVNMVHSYGLKFIEELTFEEKRQIISISSLDKVMGSSMSWIKMSDISYKKIKEYTNKYRDITLKDLIELINNRSLQIAIGRNNPDNTEITSQTDKIGFTGKVKENNEFEDMEQFLEKDVLNLDFLSVKSAMILTRNGARKAKDVIDKTTEQLKKMRGMGEKSFEEIITYFHNKGLLFADEVEKMFTYSSTIHEQLEETSKADELLAKYNALSAEKEQLQIRAGQLDSEINEVLAQLKGMNKGVGNGQPKK